MSNQECTIALIEMLREQGKIKLNEEILNALNYNKEDNASFNVIRKREELQYGTAKEMDAPDFAIMETLAKEMLEQTKKIISS